MIKSKKADKDFFRVVIYVSAIVLVFCFAKYGYFIDEIFTLGCANSHNAPFITMINGGNVNNTVLERADFLHYLAVDNHEAFDFRSVFYNLSYDTQPPLYFLLLNGCSSFFQNVFSKWIGLGLNLILFWATLLFFYKVCRLLELDQSSALLAMLMFGLSNSLVSNLLNIRMNILFVCLSIALVYLFVLNRKTNQIMLCPLIGLTIFLGAMTQYLFLIFAFFLCAAYLLYHMVNRNWKNAICIGVFSLAGVVLLPLVFPCSLESRLFGRMGCFRRGNARKTESGLGLANLSGQRRQSDGHRELRIFFSFGNRRTDPSSKPEEIQRDSASKE